MSATKSLNPLDRLFLAAETSESLMHVGSLTLFSPPAGGGGREVLRALRDELKQNRAANPPWNLKLRHPEMLSSPLQAWVEDREIDIDYHVRRSALPSPGDERELGILVSRLHSNKIDFHRPPWECYFIEGLEGGRVALYFKVHHALVDGYTGMRLFMRSLSRDASDLSTPMFYRVPPVARAPREEEPAATLSELLHVVRAQLGASKDAAKALLNVVRASREKDRALVAPLQAPKSVLNGKISRNRRFATQRYEVERLRRVAKAHDGTLNDAVLALCASAIRRLLAEQGSLPSEALTAMLPVNVRPKDDPGGGNEVGAILASLATDVADPVARLQAIIASTKRAKSQLQGMSKSAILQYSTLLLTPALLSQIPGAVGRLRPAFNVVVSNVPGSEVPLHFRGWRAEAVYPLSIPFHGHGLNITVHSYAGALNFGFIGCRDAIPHLQRLAVYSGEALEELEATLPGG